MYEEHPVRASSGWYINTTLTLAPASVVVEAASAKALPLGRWWVLADPGSILEPVSELGKKRERDERPVCQLWG